MTTYELKELWYNDGDMTMEEFIEVVRADERAKVLDELVRLVCKYYNLQEEAGYYADTNKMIKYRIADFAEQIKEQK